MSKETLKELINDSFPDNTTRKITPEDLRGVTIQMVDETATSELATETSDGLMSSEDKQKLDKGVTAKDTSISVDDNELSVAFDTVDRGNVAFELTPNGIKATVDVSEFRAVIVESLPPTGENSVYYLIQTAKENVYQKYLWALITLPDTYDYINLGTTDIDLTGYVLQSELDNDIETYIVANYTPLDMLVEYTDGTSETFKVLTQNP